MVRTSFIFVLLPAVRYETVSLSRHLRQYYLDIFSFAQGLLLLFYTMIGYWKLYAGILAVMTHNALGLFSPDALTYIVASRMVTGHIYPFLGQILLTHPYFGFPSYAWVVYIELFSILVWLRPGLHRTWG